MPTESGRYHSATGVASYSAEFPNVLACRNHDAPRISGFVPRIAFYRCPFPSCRGLATMRMLLGCPAALEGTARWQVDGGSIDIRARGVGWLPPRSARS